MRQALRAYIFAMALVVGGVARSEEPVVFAGITETSGGGAIAGTSFKNGYQLAIDEINRAGGLRGRQIGLMQFDIDTNAEIAKNTAVTAAAAKPFLILGPVFSGITLATMPVLAGKGIPQFTGAEAASVTRQFPTTLFRTSLTQEIAIPRLASFVKYAFQAKRIALVWVDNAFGRDGKDLFLKAINRLGTGSVIAMPVVPGQTDFAETVRKVQQAEPDVLVVYTNEPEAMELLKELKRKRFAKPVIGEGPVVSQQVIDLAGQAAEGVYAHTGVTVDALEARVQAFAQRYRQKYQVRADHNSLKGYFAVYAIKSVVDRTGVTSAAHFVAEMKKASFDRQKDPNALVVGSYDMFGTLYRQSYLVQIRDGKQTVLATVASSEGQTVELANGKDVYLNSPEGRRLFFAKTNRAAE